FGLGGRTLLGLALGRRAGRCEIDDGRRLAEQAALRLVVELVVGGLRFLLDLVGPLLRVAGRLTLVAPMSVGELRLIDRDVAVFVHLQRVREVVPRSLHRRALGVAFFPLRQTHFLRDRDRAFADRFTLSIGRNLESGATRLFREYCGDVLQRGAAVLVVDDRGRFLDRRRAARIGSRPQWLRRFGSGRVDRLVLRRRRHRRFRGRPRLVFGLTL